MNLQKITFIEAQSSYRKGLSRSLSGFRQVFESLLLFVIGLFLNAVNFVHAQFFAAIVATFPFFGVCGFLDEFFAVRQLLCHFSINFLYLENE